MTPYAALAAALADELDHMAQQLGLYRELNRIYAKHGAMIHAARKEVKDDLPR